MNKLSIIIPVYNEEKTIEAVLNKLAALSLPEWEKEIIVVDDGSKDNSKLKAQSLKLQFKIQNCQIVSHGKNSGKGAAIKTALKYATGDHAIIQDADLEYEPNDIPSLLQVLKEEKAEAIYGSRNLKPKRRGYFLYVLGAGILTWLVNFLYGANLTDLYTGYKLIKTSLLKSLPLECHGFEFEAEITIRLLQKGIKIREVPIHYYPRTFAQGKKIGFCDAVKGFWMILKNRF